ncbi:MAG: M4 family metallopeptidase [Clostridia bacterium]|nr:M4 family metallopeptidase [Clostridia bacterium]
MKSKRSMKTVTRFKSVLAALLTAALLLPGLTGLAEEAAALPDQERINEISFAMETRGNVVTTVITEPFYEGVTDEDSAIDALESVWDRLGADEHTQLLLDAVYETEDLTYYTFRQTVGSVVVESAGAKLIADKEGRAVCAVGSLVAGLDFDAGAGEEEEFTAEQAENVVREVVKGTQIDVYEGMSHQALVDFDGSHLLVWVVYTDRDADGLDVAYNACYVDPQGRFLGSVPVSRPYAPDTEHNSVAELAFAGLEPDVWSGEVTLQDGSTRALVVPVLRDADGVRYLGDLQRKILCVDDDAWENRNEMVVRTEKDGRFDDGELLIYDSIIRVWDFYADIGWTGPDGKGTPTLLMMDLVDEEGNPVLNAYYGGQSRGFQTFAFNRVERDGETLDVIGHEFTHCVTTVLCVNAPYINDTGAINESLSDIMGNLMEEMLDASDDPDWLIGEAAKNPDQIIRCMSSPHLYDQPEFIWDRYYYPAVFTASQGADSGGVHRNSSLLSLIAWRLHEAGMEPEDEFNYMMNVILTLTGTITYPELAALLPWCLKQAGLEQYMDVLQDAIRETGIDDILPVRYAEGCGMVTADIPEDVFRLRHDLKLSFSYVDEKDEVQTILTWPDARLGLAAAALPAGVYTVSMYDYDTDREWLLLRDEWLEVTNLPPEQVPEPAVFEFEQEEIYALPVFAPADPAEPAEPADPAEPEQVDAA